MDLTDKSQLIQYLKQHNLWAKKGLSQNFLVDESALEKIVKAAQIKDNDLVIEIGPGPGSLTSELIKNAGEVIAIEMDKEYANLLPETLNQKLEIQNSNVQNNFDIESFKFVLDLELRTLNLDRKIKIICGDILKLNLSKIIGNRPYKVVANIPYHITSKILQLFLSRENKPELMVLLVQKEVAERICANPGDMSVLSVSVQLYGEPEIIGIVPKESFLPSPKVDSAILRIVISKPKTISPKQIQNSNDLNSKHISYLELRASNLPSERDFFRLVNIGFAARRKTLVNNIMNGYHLERNKVIGIIKKMNVKETVRAQELSLKQWKILAGAIKDVD